MDDCHYNLTIIIIYENSYGILWHPMASNGILWLHPPPNTFIQFPIISTTLICFSFEQQSSIQTNCANPGSSHTTNAGPDYWALNPKWTHCSKGRKQSPVDINTNKVIYYSISWYI